MVFKKYNFLTALLTMVLAIFLITANASAGPACDLTPGSGALSIPTWYEYLPGEIVSGVNGECQIKDDLGGRAVLLILMGVFDILLYVAGFLAVILFAYGAFRLLVSNGDSNKIAAARTTMLNALIGVAIAVIASQVVGFVARNLA